MKIVLDANVLFSAFTASGLCNALFERIVGRCEIWTSQPLLRETVRAMRRKGGLSAEDAADVVSFLRVVTRTAAPLALEGRVCRDPDDDRVLGLVRRVRPQYLVSGDRDLLVLGAFEGARIVTPREFMSLADSLLGEEE